MTLRDALAGGMWGLLVGDALGVPYEFQTEEDWGGTAAIDMPPPAAFVRSHPDAPAQAWSDDGAQALCLLAERDNGNGSLMRVLPLALWHRGTDDELIRDAARQSLVTHAHPRSQVCCALYCMWVRAALHGASDPWTDATRRVRAFSAQRPAWMLELDEHIRPEREPSGTGSGYVVDCLHSARLATQEPTFEQVMRRAVSLGDDTDTTAAVAGGFAGVRHGLSGIPERWLQALSGRNLAEPLVTRLLEDCLPEQSER